METLSDDSSSTFDSEKGNSKEQVKSTAHLSGDESNKNRSQGSVLLMTLYLSKCPLTPSHAGMTFHLHYCSSANQFLSAKPIYVPQPVPLSLVEDQESLRQNTFKRANDRHSILPPCLRIGVRQHRIEVGQHPVTISFPESALLLK